MNPTAPGARITAATIAAVGRAARRSRSRSRGCRRIWARTVSTSRSGRARMRNPRRSRAQIQPAPAEHGWRGRSPSPGANRLHQPVWARSDAESETMRAPIPRTLANQPTAVAVANTRSTRSELRRAIRRGEGSARGVAMPHDGGRSLWTGARRKASAPRPPILIGRRERFAGADIPGEVPASRRDHSPTYTGARPFPEGGSSHVQITRARVSRTPSGPQTLGRAETLGWGAGGEFLDELSRHPFTAPRPLPIEYRPIATVIVGERPVRVSTSTASRRALARVGKRAATTGDTIHLDRERPAPEVIAHELTHVAHPSPSPRFFADDDRGPEERQAEQVAAVMRRSPILPRTIAADAVAAPATTTRTGSNHTIRRSTTPAAAGAGTISAAALAASITGGSAVEHIQRRQTGRPEARRDQRHQPGQPRTRAADRDVLRELWSATSHGTDDERDARPVRTTSSSSSRTAS